uniref:Uncharacterized protein n=1 Tax=Bionectria ochroleuca TaxID=29856 RepID=A0A0B7K682_BIOOC
MQASVLRWPELSKVLALIPREPGYQMWAESWYEDELDEPEDISSLDQDGYQYEGALVPAQHRVVGESTLPVSYGLLFCGSIDNHSIYHQIL